MRAINILENPGEFYDLCVKEGWTDESEEDFDELAMFEGDPDMIRVNGKTGYFFIITILSGIGLKNTKSV